MPITKIIGVMDIGSLHWDKTKYTIRPVNRKHFTNMVGYPKYGVIYMLVCHLMVFNYHACIS